jgi:hypothetical protein
MATTLATQRIEIGDLAGALAMAWSREASADPACWTEANPAWGQCAVSALVVQDYLGGSILRGEVGVTSHYWNLLPSGEEIDLTRDQFGSAVQIENVEPRTREHVLSHPDTERRYRRLAASVHRRLRNRLPAPRS